MPIDRKALVAAQNPTVHTYDSASFLSVGNGNFTFSVDCTGLQTILPDKEGQTPLCTMSSWGMHDYPGKEEKHYERLLLRRYACATRTVGYMTDATDQEELFNDLRVNPHRFNLGRIGLYAEGCTPSEFLDRISGIEEQLDLYRGVITSRFFYQGSPVQVQTLCHPQFDQVSIRLASPLLREGRLKVLLAFPYASHTISGADYQQLQQHTSTLAAEGNGRYRIDRTLDQMHYVCQVQSEASAKLTEKSRHTFLLESESDVLEASIWFSPDATGWQAGSFEEAKTASEFWWKAFWEDGAFIDLSQSEDSRAAELQRRMILSRYLLAIQSSGDTPPAETGLTCNSWYGKFHLEMHLLHAAHFAVFGQPALLERSLSWYLKILPGAYERAKSQGYQGARWPKMTDPSGNDSPSAIGTLLCWQQPHPIFYGVLLKKTHPESPLLPAWATIIEATAAFMADYVVWDEEHQWYVLGSPVIPVQENHDPESTLNPTFELSYWRWALEEAIHFLEDAKIHVDPKLRHVVGHLAPLPQDGNVYLSQQNCPDTYGAFAYDHPSLLFSLGLLDGRDVDHRIMANSLDQVLKSWDLNALWGWDFPLMAMNAARLGRFDLAVDLLLMESEKNTYTPNGHNAQLPKPDLPLYLPGNGALLLALSLMAGGLGAGPLFPSKGWVVRSEGLRRFW